MSDQRQDLRGCRPEDQGMSIHTRKITDSCRDKDCIEDLRVFLPGTGQSVLENANHVRIRCGELIHSRVNLEPVAFDRSHYCVDVTFFYRLLVDCVTGIEKPTTIDGLAFFSKRVVLCGEDARAYTYRSDDPNTPELGPVAANNHPAAVVEVLDPMVLSYKVREVCDCRCDDPTGPIPQRVRAMFDEDLVMGNERRRLYVTLGQFSIIRMERDVQVVIPVVSYSVPMKECTDTDNRTEDPCEMFAKIPFPTTEFSPRNCDRKDPDPHRGGCSRC